MRTIVSWEEDENRNAAELLSRLCVSGPVTLSMAIAPSVKLLEKFNLVEVKSGRVSATAKGREDNLRPAPGR